MSDAIAPRSTRRVLFALRAHERPAESLRSAAAWCADVGAELHVLRVLPHLTMARPAPFDSSLAARAVEELRAQHRASLRWLSETLDAAPEHDAMRVRRGRFVDCALATAEELDAEMIVIAPSAALFDHSAEQLAARASLPILIARASHADERKIVAATNLEDAAYPVLSRAAALAAPLRASVTHVHNMQPVLVYLQRMLRHPRTVHALDQVVSEQRAAREGTLRGLRDRFARTERAVIAHRDSAADTILREARRLEADLVVVGYRPRAWWRRILRPSVASQVVRHFGRSVLLAPLDAPAG